ncbi:MAG: 4-hydroxy-tetrahydrodipicolinate synthase [Acidaminococcales bacterium]|jgi:4-hydroxy-tetrahydrodipicolinate synthase|nr:4-hydroxy-tetrahydrodipicolinate synthase [Acidaminococcales bacterium]
MKVPYFGRLLTAMVTPMHADGSVNYQAAADLADYLLSNGSDGIVVAGSTGESATLTDEEKLRLFSVVAEKAKGRGAVVGGTGSNDTRKSAELTEKAKDTGVDGVMLVGPYYNKPTQEGFYRHFCAIAGSTDLPVIIYNVPGRTASNILPETIARLVADACNIVAVKEAAGNIEQAAQLRKLLPADFTIYSGDDGMTLPMLAVGGNGVISVAGHVTGVKMQEMMSAFIAGDVKKAAMLHIELLDFFKMIFITTNPIPIKAITSVVSKIDCGPLRLPLTEITAGDREKLIAVYNKLNNTSFC